MKSLIVIPVRYDSTRLPGKPMALISGKPMIQHVYEQCIKSDADKVIIATDSILVKKHMESIGCEVYMTGQVTSGTNRIINCVLSNDKLQKYDIIVNVQGDEPFIHPDDINLVISSCKKNESVSTLVTKLEKDELIDRNSVKAYVDYNSQVLMFTRSPIFGKIKGFYKHIGIYAYNKKSLLSISEMGYSQNETIDNLEQLRWADNGLKVFASYTENKSIGVDTPEDLEKAILFSKNEI
jgi:3-deoxy-manno-octulosonate cytidylyltransferase (CMP-KDO synthetase)